jgi:hypothetical protein
MHPRSIAHLGSARTAGARGASLMFVVLVLLGCDEPPVQWGATRTVPAVPASTVSPDGSLHPDSMAMLAAHLPPPERAVCPGSLALSRASGRLYAAWWRVRPDSGALLLAAHTGDEGRTWSTPAPVDTTDRSVSGCNRSPPAIAADSASGYVHVVFALLGREGPGLFYAHSMDEGATFHSAVPIFYGDRLGRSSVAADGDLVAVAFEDPNSRTPRIGLALSRTMGHIFEERLLPISDDHGVATHPLAAVRDRRVAVAWHRRASSDSAAPVLVVRTGVVR